MRREKSRNENGIEGGNKRKAERERDRKRSRKGEEREKEEIIARREEREEVRRDRGCSSKGDRGLEEARRDKV